MIYSYFRDNIKTQNFDTLGNFTFRVNDRKIVKITREQSRIIYSFYAEQSSLPESSARAKPSTIITFSVSEIGNLQLHLTPIKSRRLNASEEVTNIRNKISERALDAEVASALSKFNRCDTKEPVSFTHMLPEIVESLPKSLISGKQTSEWEDECVLFVWKDLQSLMQRAGTETVEESLPTMYSRSQDSETVRSMREYMKRNSYPLSTYFPDIATIIDLATEPVCDALSQKTVEDLINNVTRSRENALKDHLRSTLKQQMNGTRIVEKARALLFLFHAVNRLVATKESFSTSDRMSMILSLENHRSRSKYEDSKWFWEIISMIIKNGSKNNQAMLKVKRVLCRKSFVSAVPEPTQNETKLQYQQLYWYVMSDKEEYQNKDLTVISSSGSGCDEPLFQLKQSFTPEDLRQDYQVDEFLKHFTSIRNRQRSSIPTRISNSFDRHFKDAHMTGYVKFRLDSFLDDERKHISKRLKEVGVGKVNPDDVESLLELTFNKCLDNSYRSRFDIPSGKNEKYEIPENILKAIRDGLSATVIQEISLTEVNDYELILGVADLPHDYRRAVLGIE